MNFFNSQATTNRNIFNTNPPQQNPPTQNNPINIFANNNPPNTNTNENIFKTTNTSQQNQPSSQQQQQQNQPQVLQQQNKPLIFQQQNQAQSQPQNGNQTQTTNILQKPQATNPTNPANSSEGIPRQPLIRDNLCEKHSFIKILKKVNSMQKLSPQEIIFVKNGGQVYFKQDKWKSNYFMTQITKKDHLGFSKQQIVYQGDIPRCKEVEDIFVKIIGQFAQTCETHEMNGYFLLKNQLRNSKFYKYFYKPKPGLDNKVFEINKQFLLQFYLPQIQNQKPVLNLKGKYYVQFLTNLVRQFNQEWNAFLDIIYIVMLKTSRHLRDQNDNHFQSQDMNDPQSNRKLGTQSEQNIMAPRSPAQQGNFRHLHIKDFIEKDILKQLFQSYKVFCLGKYENKQKYSTKDLTQLQQQFFINKKILFFRIGDLISSILQTYYTQQKLLQKQPLPLVEVAQFINADIKAVRQNSFIQPLYEQKYIKIGVKIVLGLIPFAAFINIEGPDPLRLFFQLPRTKTQFSRTLTKQYKEQLIKILLELDQPIFKPFRLWASTQRKCTQTKRLLRNNVNRNNSEQDKHEKEISALFSQWQQFFRNNSHDLEIFEKKIWSNLVSTLVLTLGVESILKKEYFRSVLIYYTKKTLKKGARHFWDLWRQLLYFYEDQAEFQKLQTKALRQKDERIIDGIIKISKQTIRQFPMFVAGKIFREVLELNFANQTWRIMTKLLKDQKSPNPNYTQQLFRFVDTFKENRQQSEEIKRSRQNFIQNKQDFNENLLKQQYSKVLIGIVVSQIVKQYRIPFFSMKGSYSGSLIFENLHSQTSYSDGSDHESCEQEIKFICRLIQVNSLELGILQNRLFSDSPQMNKMRNSNSPQKLHQKSVNQMLCDETDGLQICVFLCILLGKLDLNHNLNEARYIIETIDILFNNKETRKAILLAISIVFPLNMKYSMLKEMKKPHSVRGNDISHINRSTFNRIPQQNDPKIYSLLNIVEYLHFKMSSEDKNNKSIKKLYHTLSHHLHHIVQYSDSIETYFPSNTSAYTPIFIGDQNIGLSPHQIYGKIENQLITWDFKTASDYIKSNVLVYRPSDWFYSFVKLLTFPQLLPVNIDTIILLINKMCISTEDSPSYLPMLEILKELNSTDLLKQMIDFLEPVIVSKKPISKKLLDKTSNSKASIKDKEKLTQNQQAEKYKSTSKKQLQIQIFNKQLKNYQPLEHYQLAKCSDNSPNYNKLSNPNVVRNKNIVYVLQQQQQIIRKLALYARLIEEILKIKLDPQFQTYSLLENLQIIQQVYSMFTDPERVQNYTVEYIQKSENMKETVNLHSVILSLLNLYEYEFLIPTKNGTCKYLMKNNKSLFILRKIETQSNFSFSYQKKYAHFIFRLELGSTSNEIHKKYENEASTFNAQFFKCVPYVSSDFGAQNDNLSLKTCIFTIFQLLSEHKAGSLVTKSISNYSYPTKIENLFTKLNPGMTYLKPQKSKSQLSLLFKYIKLSLLQEKQDIRNRKIQVQARTLQSLSILLSEDLFYNEIIDIIADVRTQLVRLLTEKSSNQDKLYWQKSTEVNIYNKIALFFYQLTKVTLNKHEEHLSQVINELLIRPTNLLRMLFGCLIEMNEENLLTRDILLVKSHEFIPNYYMQQKLTRITIFRATLDIIYKTIINLSEHIPQESLNELLVYVLRFLPFAATRVVDLEKQNDMVKKLNLSPLEVIMMDNEPEDNIKTTILSQQITDFKYCYRTNVRKYGNNFMFSNHTAFHRLKVYQQAITQSDQNPLRKTSYYFPYQAIRKELFHVQLTNCMKSVSFANQSMVKSYFQLMNFLANTGLNGRNLSVHQIDRLIPKIHETKINMNKYGLENKFSFFQSLFEIQKISVNLSLPIIIKTCCQYLLNNIALRNPQKLETEIMFRNSSANQIYRLQFQQFLQIKQVECLNPDHIVKFITKLIQSTIQFTQQNYKISLHQNLIPLKQLLYKVLTDLKSKKINCTLKVLLLAFQAILTSFQKVIKMTQKYYEEKNVPSVHRTELESIKKLYVRVQQDILLSIQEIVFKCLQRQRPTLHLRQSPMFRQSSLFQTNRTAINLESNRLIGMSQLNENIVKFEYSRSQLMQNISEVCALCTCVLQYIDKGKTQGYQSRQFQPLTQKINYFLKLLVENQQEITEPLSRVMLFNLCNKFYFTHAQNNEVQKWPFFHIQMNICDELMMNSNSNQKQTNNDYDDDSNKFSFQNDHYWLEKINVFDTYCTLALVNDKIFTNELLTILLNIIETNGQFANRQYRNGSPLKSSKKSDIQYQQENSAFMVSKKRYNLRRFKNKTLTIDKLIEYKKLMTTILVTFTEDNWVNDTVNIKTNLLFLQILNFNAIEFSLERLFPNSRVQNRLKGLIVCEGQRNEIFRLIQEQRLSKMKGYEDDSNYKFSIQSPTKNQNNPKTGNTQIKSYLSPVTIEKNPAYSTSKTKQQNLFMFRSRFDNKRSSFEINKHQQVDNSQSSLSLFQFVGFIHHNEMIFNWMLAVKTGLNQSSIMKEIGGFILQTEEYNQIWINITNKIIKLYHYFADYVELFMENPTLTQNLTNLYNFIAQQPAYLYEFNGLTIYFDVLQENYVETQLINSIIEYVHLVLETVKKSREIQWKCQRNWNKQRLACLSKCAELLLKNKLPVTFKKFNLWDSQYNKLRQNLHEEIQYEKNLAKK